MKKRNLLLEPCWRGEDLGQSLPDSPHAVSVALPRWQDVIDYEEKEARCIKTLKTIYPRFGLNPLVAEVAKKAIKMSNIKEGSGWPFPSLEIAQKAKLYCEANIDSKTVIQTICGLSCLITDNKTTPFAKAFWQHTGLGASSRLAAIALGKEHAPFKEEGDIAKNILINRLSNIYDCPADLIQLQPSGMAALNKALEIIRQIRPHRPFLQLGFPYVDVLKLPQVLFGGSELVTEASQDKLAAELDRRKPAAVIVELPSNPMLQCIDLPTVSKLARERGIPIIADDTIGSAINIDPKPYSDLIFTSLTKSFAGRGDILAGSLTISSESPWRDELKESLLNTCSTPLADPDAIALETASQDIEERLPKLNDACLKLKRKLEQHPEVKRVLHPEDCSNFRKIMRPNSGYGCLLSFELIGGLKKAKKFYDSLKVCKGPSLGTNFTLVCPYVLLAHYNELGWAKKCGVPSHLLRVSVGLEDPQYLWEEFNKALNE